mgnify:CR=1 FL=1
MNFSLYWISTLQKILFSTGILSKLYKKEYIREIKKLINKANIIRLQKIANPFDNLISVL